MDSLIAAAAHALAAGVNGGDAAVLYCFAFLYILFAGGGPWSVDRFVLKQD